MNRRSEDLRSRSDHLDPRTQADSIPVTYPARYWDRFGEERTSIRNDGKNLSVTIRGVDFRGGDFDALEPPSEADSSLLTSFPLRQNALCPCAIDAEIPIPVVTPLGVTEGVLAVHLELGDPTPSAGIDRGYLSPRLEFGDRALTSRGWSGWFEDELLDIQRPLPEGIYLKACINCAFSDDSPLGPGLFGGLACFRDNKGGYKAVQSKRDLFGIWGTMTEFVQETYLCPEFERRIPGTGYRDQERTTSVLGPGPGEPHPVTLSGTNPLGGPAHALGRGGTWISISCSTGSPSWKPRTRNGP
jgi:hypothetical protein